MAANAAGINDLNIFALHFLGQAQKKALLL